QMFFEVFFEDFCHFFGIVKEPLGGAHSDPEEMAKILKKHLKKHLKELAGIDPEVRIQQRIEKFDEMGVFEELNAGNAKA
ncbi:MAG TPA: hypothetical protein PLB46_14005, partial [Chitinophagales bacterium]|nr:hypothetical protein [Chitinophagales bacterium]